MASGRILIIDDEPAIRFGIRGFLEQQGFAAGGSLVDHLLPDGDALEVLALF